MKIECPIRVNARKEIEDPAIIYEGSQFSYSQLDDVLEQVEDFLTRKGIRENNRVAVISKNSVEMVVVLWALWRIGAVVVPLNYRFPVSYIESILEKFRPPFVIVDECFGITNFTNERNSFSIIELQELGELFCRGVLRTPEKNISKRATAGRPYVRNQEGKLESSRLVILTSGSTAAEKGVLLSFSNLYYNALGSNRNIVLEPGDRWLVSLPLFHVGGIGVLFRCFLARAAVVIPNGEESILQSVERYSITHLSLVSTQLVRMLNELSQARSGLFSGIKAVLLGGSAISQELIREAISCGLPVFTTYGMSEMGSQVTTTAPGDGLEKLKTSGKLLAFRQIKIADDLEICVKGETLFQGYIDGDGVVLPVDSDRWFHTGDLGRIDSQGYLEVIGRKDNMFISGGENIVPEEIEAVLEGVPGIERVVVVPKVDEEFGFRPVCFIKRKELDEGGESLSEQNIIEYLKGRLPGFKVPRVFYEWPSDYKDGDSLKVKRPYFKEIAKLS